MTTATAPPVFQFGGRDFHCRSAIAPELVHEALSMGAAWPDLTQQQRDAFAAEFPLRFMAAAVVDSERPQIVRLYLRYGRRWRRQRKLELRDAFNAAGRYYAGPVWDA